ncbi:DNA-binding domain-containing protein [Psychrobium sp. 1_MG-2023]|uniref:HvfC/BufC N-terminal domain-containing protein n=1 Tax=Psychrobium sp. 1_MG-2023 TaxID=3062624 RepID=UPI000C33F322|nr:DNA-binding domain-containing protein [Psychrobium sp. 1_MG-2023]MDP2561906.1 DNA-binding domain-containing protein [Psychrobium sp. 1_MG-2023]PKF59678.1 DUF2063 domain-containing protein [Alteromonadales bacterium alter-6D02]
MPDLALIQQQFLDYLQGKSNSFSDNVINQPPVTIDTRLGIYKNAYKMRLRETIDNDHPQLGKYLGDELYDALVDGYVATYPSKVRSLRHFCHNIPQYLATQRPFSSHPILTDLAKFERTLLDAFDAADKPVAKMDALSNIEIDRWPDIKLTFHPSCRLFTQLTNAVESWQALKTDTAPPPAQDYPLGVFWLVWRNEQRLTEFANIDPISQVLWQSFNDGNDFSHACELLTDYCHEEQVPVEALKRLQFWINNDMVSHISTD